MYNEDDYIMLSALQHYLFCPRQCALIHLEQSWAENSLTAQGRLLHERVHESARERRGNLLIVRGLRLASARLGLSGQADAVEFHQDPAGARLPGVGGRWRPFPVEYKRGRPKKDQCDAVQLCAQAVCLEEMLDCTIAAGALYYGKNRRRTEVRFDEALREETARCAANVHRLLASGVTPPAAADARCKRCSLHARCLPQTVSKRLSRYYTALMADE